MISEKNNSRYSAGHHKGLDGTVVPLFSIEHETDSKQFMCGICAKRCNTAARLELHSNWHKMEKRYWNATNKTILQNCHRIFYWIDSIQDRPLIPKTQNSSSSNTVTASNYQIIVLLHWSNRLTFHLQPRVNTITHNIILIFYFVTQFFKMMVWSSNFEPDFTSSHQFKNAIWGWCPT